MLKNIILFLKFYGKRVRIKKEHIDEQSAIRYGDVVGVKKGKVIVNVFDYGLYYNKEYTSEALELE